MSDVDQLAAEFPAWDFAVQWITANSGSDGRTLYAWSLEFGGPPLTASSAEEMRRQIREARG